MNILYITNHLNIGGITSYVFNLACGLKKRGHSVYVASSGGELVSPFKSEDIGYIPIPIRTKNELSPKIIISMFKLTGVIKRINIDIVHSNTRTTQVLGCLVARHNRIAHIFTCHGFFKRRILRRLFPCWGDRVIAISGSVKEHLKNDFGVNEKDIRLVHNGIDVDRFKTGTGVQEREKKKELGLSDGPVIGIIARLSDVKGHIYLIRAMKDVLVKEPKAQLLIVGEGKMKSKLVRLVHDLKIAGNVFFVPEVQDTRDLLSVMDLFAMPSLKEGLGLSLIEAMASGVAAVGSDVGGIRNLIRDGTSGRLVRPADSRALAETLIELLRDGAKREAMAKEARDFVAQNFSRERMALETERIYLECLNAR